MNRTTPFSILPFEGPAIFLACAGIFIACAGSADGQSITISSKEVIHGQGNLSTPNRIQIAIVGDGFTAGSSMETFHDKARRIIDKVFEHPPYKVYKNAFVVTRLDVASTRYGCGNQKFWLEAIQDSSADDINMFKPNPPYWTFVRAQKVNQAMGERANGVNITATAHAAIQGWWIEGEHPITYSEGGTNKTMEAIQATVQALGDEGANLKYIIILANDPSAINGVARVAGVTPQYILVGSDVEFDEANDPNQLYPWTEPQGWGVPEVLAHELGHAVFGLVDEYAGKPDPIQYLIGGQDGNVGTRSWPDGEYEGPNVSLNSTEGVKKWKRWTDAGVLGGGSPYAGGDGYNSPFHAEQMCKMNRHQGSMYIEGSFVRAVNPGGIANSHPFGPVCYEGVVQGLYSKVSLIEKQIPENHFIEVANNGSFAGADGRPVLRIETIASEELKIKGEWFFDGSRVEGEENNGSLGKVFDLPLGTDRLTPGYHLAMFMGQDKTPILTDRADDPVAFYPPFIRIWFLEVKQPSLLVRLQRLVGWDD